MLTRTMSIIKKIFVGLYLFINLLVGASGQTTDSLQAVLKDAQGVDRVDILHQLVLSIWLNYPEQAMRYGNEALAISTDLKDSTIISKSLREKVIII